MDYQQRKQFLFSIKYFQRTLLGGLNGVAISILNIIYKKIANLFVKWENHRLQSDYDDSLISSIFIFQFINSYITLLYLAFYPQDLKIFGEPVWDGSTVYGERITKLEATIFSLILSKTAVNLIIVNYFFPVFLLVSQTQFVPMIIFKLRFRSFRKKFIKQRNVIAVSSNSEKKNLEDLFVMKYEQKDFGENFLKDVVDDDPEKALSFDDEIFLAEQIERSQIMLPRQKQIMSYTNLAILFGYIGMFSTVYLPVPLFCFIFLNI